MAAERTELEDQFLLEHFKTLPIIENLGLSRDGIFDGINAAWSEFATEPTLKVPRRKQIGEKIVTWRMLGSTHEFFDDTRVFAVDTVFKRPNYSVRYLHQDEVDGVGYPASIRAYSYTPEVTYVKSIGANRPVPVDVTRQTIEIFNCLPKKAGPASRIGFHVSRMVYKNSDSDQNYFAPFMLLYRGVFQPAPDGYLGSLGESGVSELWVEKQRILRVNSKDLIFEFDGKSKQLVLRDSEKYFSSEGGPVAPLVPEEVYLPRKF